jgi:hypothetical protein
MRTRWGSCSGRELARLLQSPRIDFTIPSLAPATIGDRHFETPADLEYGVATARI